MSETLDFDLVAQQAAQAARERLEAANPAPGDFFVVGCSSSEIVGGHIGKNSSLDAAAAVYAGIAPLVKERGLWLAAQCCEHLNRALIVEKAALPPFTPVVNVLPQPHAGGSWATTCWQNFEHPAAVEALPFGAGAGMDIGGTLIGMHLRPVAVPVRLSLDHIGQAILLCGRSRPKYIGGERAHYQPELR